MANQKTVQSKSVHRIVINNISAKLVYCDVHSEEAQLRGALSAQHTH